MQPPDQDNGVRSGGADVPAFAPNTPTDGRGKGNWKSRYDDKSAQRAIILEAAFVWAFLILALILIVAVALQAQLNYIPLPELATARLAPFFFSFLGGFLGGTLFSMKWLYHTVAKGIWNRDRRLWRVFTPLLSAGAALTIILLCASGVLPFFGPELVRSHAGALGLSIVFGYFSDRAFSALGNVMTGIGMTDVAEKPKKLGSESQDSSRLRNNSPGAAGSAAGPTSPEINGDLAR